MKLQLPLFLLIVVVTGIHAVSYIGDAENIQDVNPSFLSELHQKTFSLLYTRQNGDDVSTGQWSFTGPVGLYGLYQTFGLTHRFSFQDEMNDVAHWLYASYAYNVWRQLSIGTNIGGIYDKVDDPSASLKLDLGISWRLLNDPVIGEHLAGFAVRDLFTRNTRFSQPESVNFSWWMKFLEGKLQFCSDIAAMDAFSHNRYMTFDTHAGLYLLPFSVALSAGKNRLGCSLGFFSAWSNNCEARINLHFSTNVKSVRSNLIALQTDISFLRSREEKYSALTGRVCCCAPCDKYNMNRKLFDQKEYYNALTGFSYLVREYPDFFKSNWCHYFIGLAYVELGMLQIAKNVFHETLNMFDNATLPLFIDKELLEIMMEERNDENVTKYIGRLFSDMAALNDSFPSLVDSMKNEVHFTHAEYLLSENRFTEALSAYQLIGSDHVKYRSARIAIAALLRYRGTTSESEEILSLLHREDSIDIRVPDTDSALPVTSGYYDSLRAVIESETEVIQLELDSAGIVLFDILQRMRSEKTFPVVDSLGTVQRKLSGKIERKRLLRNPLYKKWQMLGKDLLPYLKEDEFDLLLRCHRLVTGYGE